MEMNCALRLLDASCNVSRRCRIESSESSAVPVLTKRNNFEVAAAAFTSISENESLVASTLPLCRRRLRLRLRHRHRRLSSGN